MFGDILHGTILLAFAVLCIIFEEKLKDVDQEMFKIPFGGRYMLIIMSVSAIYMGFIYNELASVPVDLFGTRYGTATHLDFHTNPSGFDKTPYTLGVDPIWRWSNNNVGFTNSMKMKMAIILGVLHMTLGVILKAFNMIHFGDRLSLYCESVPEVLLFMSIFGYLCILIFIKWGTNWNVGEDCAAKLCFCENCTHPITKVKFNMTEFSGECETYVKFLECAASTSRIQYPRGPPMLITTLIGLAFMGDVKHQDVLLFPNACDPGPSGVCYGQGTLQTFLLLIAGLSAPAMLLIKPFVLKNQNEKEDDGQGDYGMVGNVRQDDEDEGEGLVGVGSPVENQGDEDEGFNFAEVFIHQIIHTIEYALGTVSNTASYLRLWALSLAHSQLSEVFWDMILLGEKFGVGLCAASGGGSYHVFMIFFCFFIWFCATMAVLMIMESLSAFLHALRLQWVEFQNKFYASDGILFHPDSFDMVEAE
jgi:V-type H+-transporting ATPase subunit a